MQIFQQLAKGIRHPFQLLRVPGRLVFFPGWERYEGVPQRTLKVPADPHAPVVRGIFHAMWVDGVQDHEHIVMRFRVNQPFRLGVVFEGRQPMVTKRLLNNHRWRDVCDVMMRRENEPFWVFGVDVLENPVQMELARADGGHADLFGSDIVHVARWPEDDAPAQVRRAMMPFGHNV